MQGGSDGVFVESLPGAFSIRVAFGESLDSRFRALPRDVWEQILAYNLVNLEHYKSEHFDYDKFAVGLAGDVSQRWDISVIDVVIDTSARHAYNCVLADDGGRLDLLMVEPQTVGFVVRGCGYDARSGW